MRGILILVAGLLLASCAGSDPTFNDGGGDYAMVRDTLSCLPDNDGDIEQSELVFQAGMAAKFRVNPPGTLDTLDAKGKLVDGKLEWDFSSVKGAVAQLKVESVSGTWFAKHFPTGDIAMITTAKGDTLQVLQLGPGRVLLLGLASRKPDHTLTIYDPPVVAMKFPLKVGQSFSSSASLKPGAKINGQPFTSKDTYQVSIKKEGAVRLPNLRLHRTLLIETLVTVKTVGGKSATTRQLQWFSECYGEVIRALSQIDEKQPYFTKAVELRRLAM